MVHVALYTSAWIEIDKRSVPYYLFRVALYTSAWIEITVKGLMDAYKASRTLHECVD